MKSKRAFFYLLLLGFGLIFSCGGKRNYSVEIKDGIRLVHNKKPALPEPAAHLEFVRRIGEMESEDEDLMFDLAGRYVDRFTMGRYDGLYMRVLKSENVVGYSMNVGGENNRENTILKIFDLEGKTLFQFGEPMLLANVRDSWSANFLSLSLDTEDNIYAAFAYQNRIEKYSPTGELLMSIDRELSFPVEYKTVKETMEIGGQARQIDRLKSTAVSRGMGIDGLSRIWILAFIKEVPEINERDEYIPQEYNKFEVYNPEGILLFHVPLPEEIKSFDNYVMVENTIYFIDPYGECCVFEYKIVER